MMLETVNRRLQAFATQVAGSTDLKLRQELETLKSDMVKFRALDAEVESLKKKLRETRQALEAAQSPDDEDEASEEEVLQVIGRAHIDLIVASSKKVTGTTVGIQLTAGVRDRLLAQKEKLSCETYRQVVTVAVEVGLNQMEKIVP